MSERTQAVFETYTIKDPEQFTKNMLLIAERASRALAQFMERADNQTGAYSVAAELEEGLQAITEIMAKWTADPARLVTAQTQLMEDYAAVWANFVRRSLGEDVPPYAEPQSGDNRFQDEDWYTNPYFDFWKQSYLVTTRWADKMLEETDGLDELHRKRAEYYFNQLFSALSPSNFPMTNPEVLRETIATNAENLVNGLEQFLTDVEKSGDLLKISQTDASAFEIGKNLATTPGSVIYQNEIFQLIQYTPTTEKVRKRPILVVPPWINKYYILDLTPPKSLIKFMVDQGLTVFVVSWVNPDESLSHKSFADYMTQGVLEAAKVVQAETNTKTINGMGYCVGGTLLGTTLAYLAATQKKVFKSVTFLTTQLDFSAAGDLLLFTDDSHLASLEQMMKERGYLDGSRMANVFNMMRPRDLVWPYIINNYLLGKKPFPFDLLFWNQDSTRMPAENHRFYLRQFYHDNRLALGEMEIAGTKLNLSKITTPIFDLATRDDHIAPAKSVFRGSQLMSGPVEFVLAGSGHIAGVINPPEKMKYQYWTASEAGKGSLDEWINTATENAGSWWPYWAKWIKQYSGPWTDPREPGAKSEVLEEAPGSYVRIKA